MLRLPAAILCFFVPLAAQITVRVASPVNAGQPVPVTYSGNADKLDFITIVPKTTPEGKYDAYKYPQTGNPVQLRAPEVAGEYEVRYLSGKPPYPTLARAPLTVNAVSASIDPPAKVSAGKDFSFTWKGPNNTGDFITLVKKDAPEKKYERYAYTAQGSPGTLRAPDEPGEYELRYLSGSQYLTLGRAPLTVGGVTASITPPGTVKAGAAMSFQWTGPNGTGDFIAIVPKGAPEKKYDRYVYTTKGSPASMTAPDAAGDYELRYLTAQTYTTLARAAFTVGSVTASVKGPASVEGGQTFQVNWTGPGNKLDWISIALKSDTLNNYKHYSYVHTGNPVTLNAPLAAGQYELRYQTGQSYTILARQPIQVGPPKTVPGKLRVVSQGAAPGQVGLAKTTAVEVILDASGSMLQRVGPKRRIDIARTVLTDLVTKTIPPGTPVAMRVFGHKETGSCRTDLEQPLAPLDPARTAALIAKLQPQNLAKTPIGKSLELVAQDLQSNQGERVVVLITDGEETCGGDPASAIEQLRAARVDVRVNIVGFAVDEPTLKDTFRKWARIGGGEYFDASSESQLGASLVEAVRVPFQAVNAQGQVVAEGLVDGAAVDLGSGVYTVRTKASRPQNIGSITVKPGETAVATMAR
jgi:hypothetical protein